MDRNRLIKRARRAGYRYDSKAFWRIFDQFKGNAPDAIYSAWLEGAKRRIRKQRAALESVNQAV